MHPSWLAITHHAGREHGEEQVKGYIVRHWRGQQNVLWSFAVNGVTLYLVIVAAAIATGAALGIFAGGPEWPLALLVPLFFLWLAWALVGTTRAGVAILRDHTAHWALKLSTLFVFVGLAISLYGAVTDLAIVWRWLLALLGG